MDIHSVVQEITSRVGRFKTRSFEVYYEAMETLSFKESFLDYCKEDFFIKEK